MCKLSCEMTMYGWHLNCIFRINYDAFVMRVIKIMNLLFQSDFSFTMKSKVPTYPCPHSHPFLSLSASCLPWHWVWHNQPIYANTSLQEVGHSCQGFSWVAYSVGFEAHVMFIFIFLIARGGIFAALKRLCVLPAESPLPTKSWQPLICRVSS